jgi:predicted acyl esterase
VQAASRQKWLEVHGREHWTEFYTRYGVTLQKRFLDHFLKGIDNGWEREATVQLNIRRPGEQFEVRMENEWPLARTRWTRMYLNAEDRSLCEAPGQIEGTISYDPSGDGVTFSTPPVIEETEITGPVATKLFVSSTTTDADLFLVLRVFNPAGEEVVFSGAVDPHTPVGQGWLRASHRRLDPQRSTEYRPYHPHDGAELLTPGEVYELNIEIWPTCIVVPPGHRIALTVRGKDYEYAGEIGRLGTIANTMKGCGPFLHNDPMDRPAKIFGGEVTLYAGRDHPAHVLLPIIP